MKPMVVKRSTIYLIWVIPIIAIIISGIMLFNEYAKMGESVVIIFKDVRGFKQDETPVKYKGIEIGIVKNIEVDPENLNKFFVTAKIKKSFVKYLTEGARFWKVSPKLKPTEFTGLSSIFSGSYIEFSPATSDVRKLSKLKSKRKFYGFEEEPKTNVTYFRLYSEDGSLIEGAPVLYKSFIVGNITKKSLKGNNVEYIISINNKFASLVKVDSHFWKISPVDVKASLPEFQLKVNNIFNFFFGGIQFDSPENSTPVCELDKSSEEFQVCNQKGFYLFPSRGDTEYSLKKIKLILKNAHKIQSSLKFIYYKGDIAGKVVNSDYIVEKDVKYLYVRMKRRYSGFLAYKSFFWIQKPDFESLNLSSLIKGTHIEFSFYNQKVKPKQEYILYHSRPYKGVKTIVLKAKSPIGLNEGDYLFYGKKIIGEVVSVMLNEYEEKYNCIIYKEFKNLLLYNPVFYKKNAAELNFSLENASVEVSPLKELLSGGVAMLKGSENKGKVLTYYPLFKSRKEAENYLYLNGRGLKLNLITENLNGIYEGIPVFYKSMKIGKVYKISFDEKNNRFLLKAYIEKNFKSLVKENSLFYKASGIDIKMGLQGVTVKTENLLSLLKGAIVLKNNNLNNSKSFPKKQYKLFTLEQLENREYVKGYLLSDNGYGLKEGSLVFYKGVVVGKVKALSIDNENVKITFLIDKRYSFLLSDKSRFYIEKTKFSAGEVKNIESAFLGSSLKIAYFKSGKRQTVFKLVGVNPSDTVYLEGFRIFVFAPQITSLSVGSPVLNRGVQIGQVEDISLSEDLTSVKLTLFIDKKYKNLITDNSRFLEVKPIAFKAGFIYAKVDFKSFATMIKGGIEIVTNGEGKKVEEWHKFVLQSSKE
ncbi:paraquat-inducible protein B [Thermotomaculum hydrothermale]|uniref:Paraquat-inducible protein B n=1 Tax=Thermotomaculum hydrothermale TaxID=981385 RepID=A0A7R6SZI7_9BACT|nr:MlaD family protein [Thermotomaculum hydrothermale]BBB32792.1 paraquat-inducible protein B [Thermotomaculum hydrothermale]